MEQERTREPQYQRQVTLRDESGLASLGLVTNQVWTDDPRRLVFLLSRYKFVSKMIGRYRRVLEVGCGDAFGVRLLLQEGAEVCAVDFDPVFVRDIRARMDPRWSFTCRRHDILDGPVEDRAFDAAYSLDVLEHIAPEDEDRYMRHVSASLTDEGVFIVGTPSAASQVHASPPSRAGHVNCKDGEGLRGLMSRYYRHVFLFSMNDEVVHTGFAPLAHYYFAIGVTPVRGAAG